MSSPYYNPIPFIQLSKPHRRKFQPAAEERRIHRVKNSALFLLGLLLLLPALPLDASAGVATASDSNSTWKLAHSNPAELMRRASQNELANSYGRRAPVRYRVRKITAKSDTTKQIVETSNGGVARLLAIGGHPLSASQTQQEIERLHKLDADPSIEAHRRNSELRDAGRVKKFMRLLPDAFLYQSAGSVETANGPMIRLKFVPNPKFSPPDFESRVVTGIRGEVWISPEDLRVVRIQGRIFKTVDFGWGILGSLYPGATMQIEQSKTNCCGWQLAHLGLHLDGKELIFKSLHIAVEETASDYQSVPRNWNYKDAVRWLLAMPVTPAQTKL